MFLALLNTTDLLGFMREWWKGGVSFEKKLNENAD
jgi:hypothetical protein